MKRLFLMISILAAAASTHAQVVNEVVEFDYYVSASDNDYENRFDFGSGMSQLQTNGITGGCLQTPQTENWGSDNAVYCTRFKGAASNTYTVSVCFKYDTLQLNNINFDRPVSLWLKPYVDPNHYIIGSVLDTRRIQIVSYSATASSAIMDLDHGHWYRLDLTSSFVGGVTGDEIMISSQVNDLGMTGQDPPIPEGFTSTTLYDSIMFADTAIEASLSGTRWGGSLYLDKFQFFGLKSFDNCISTDITDAGALDIMTFMDGTLLRISSPGIYQGEIEVYNVQGKLTAEKKITSEKTDVDLTALPPGVYVVSITSGNKSFREKVVLKN